MYNNGTWELKVSCFKYLGCTCLVWVHLGIIAHANVEIFWPLNMPHIQFCLHYMYSELSICKLFLVSCILYYASRTWHLCHCEVSSCHPSRILYVASYHSVHFSKRLHCSQNYPNVLIIHNKRSQRGSIQCRAKGLGRPFPIGCLKCGYITTFMRLYNHINLVI